MQDAHTGDWVWESQLPARLLGSLQELNLRFLGLRAGPGGEFGGQAAPLSPAQRLAVAGCPYALFDLKFQDDGHWCPRLQNAAPWRVADAAMGEPEAVEFVHLALFFAWHVASTAKLAAQLILGMNEATALAFRRITVDRLPQLGSKGAHLKQQMQNKLIEHKEYIDKHGQDLPEIRNWKWHATGTPKRPDGVRLTLVKA